MVQKKISNGYLNSMYDMLYSKENKVKGINEKNEKREKYYQRKHTEAEWKHVEKQWTQGNKTQDDGCTSKTQDKQ